LPKWIIIPLIPHLCDIERLKQRGECWQWSSERRSILAPDPTEIHIKLLRFKIDPLSSVLELQEPQVIHDSNTEFYRIDDRVGTQTSVTAYPTLGTTFSEIAPQLGGDHPL
ncbi:Lignostilbene alpha-beta-dioxygenase, partial [Penicillium nucicola]|uniref:Lignostilbene alpha-beta-dioxygenase n=1 Tax=Penicillium nucicola TaxID=1850975 RepID=UPI002545B81C